MLTICAIQDKVTIDLSFLGNLMWWIVIGLGWTVAMYLEQLFAVGLYLYTIQPDSRVVEILLEKHLGRELPIGPPAYKSRPYILPNEK